MTISPQTHKGPSLKLMNFSVAHWRIQIPTAEFFYAPRVTMGATLIKSLLLSLWSDFNENLLEVVKRPFLTFNHSDESWEWKDSLVADSFVLTELSRIRFVDSLPLYAQVVFSP